MVENGTPTACASIIKDFVETKMVSVYVNSFNEVAAKEFYTNFTAALKTGQSVIPVYIDSYGGYVDSVILMMDLIESSTVPVATIAMGKAMSCGSVLLSCGTEGMRFVAPTSRVMIHHMASTQEGKIPEIKVSYEESERLQKLMFAKMAQHCGKPDSYFLDILKEKGNTDWYLTPEECVSHNLANHVRLPRLYTDVIIRNEIK